MKSVDKILKNTLILTMDDNFTIYDPGAVAITGKNIVSVGSNDDILQTFSAEEVLDCSGKTLIPGLINAHAHVPMTLLRGLADDLRLDVWLMGFMMPVEREFVTPEFVQLGTKLACAELIKSGVTTFADMYYFEDDVATATKEAGMRAICGQTVLKFPSPDAFSYEDSLTASRTFIKKWVDDDLIVPAVAPHAPYTCTDEILEQSRDLALEYDVPLHIHISETEFEVENMRNNEGMPVVPYVKKLDLFDAKVIAAHCVHIDSGEIHTLQHYNTSVAHNPSSNMKLASGIAPIKEMLDRSLNVGIGTDGVASNNDQDMFEEMRLTSFLAKVSTKDPTVLPARTVLNMATHMGAKALYIDDITGSIEPGKRADITLIDINPVHNAPSFRHDPHNPYAQIIYASKATDVTDVMINGKWVLSDRVLKTIDESPLIKQGQSIAWEIDTFLKQREESVLSKLIAVDKTVEEESFEIQVKVSIEDPDDVLNILQSGNFKILYTRHYKEYDTYFTFPQKSEGYLRYREDHFIDDNGELSKVRSRLTLIGQEHEGHFTDHVALSRSRYLAPASQSLRFYREYFKPSSEFEINKRRLRYLIEYMQEEFYVNIDTVETPPLGHFLEVKSRTWSRTDAIEKSQLIIDLIKALGASPDDETLGDYTQMLE